MSDSPRTASDYFGAMGFEYDSLIHRSVPCYDAMIEKLINYLPRHPETVLELGCGSGGLSLPLVRYVPDCEFTFVDASEEMVELTRARVQEDFPETARRATSGIPSADAWRSDALTNSVVATITDGIPRAS